MVATVQIATKDGLQSVQIYRRVGPFAVHQQLESLQYIARHGRPDPERRYVLTHVPTGRSVLHAYRAKDLIQAAKMLLESAGPDGVDWSLHMDDWRSDARMRAQRAVQLLSKVIGGN